MPYQQVISIGILVSKLDASWILMKVVMDKNILARILKNIRELEIVAPPSHLGMFHSSYYQTYFSVLLSINHMYDNSPSVSLILSLGDLAPPMTQPNSVPQPTQRPTFKWQEHPNSQIPQLHISHEGHKKLVRHKKLYKEVRDLRTGDMTLYDGLASVIQCKA
ncbi:hypothetical protein C8R48DRAFT_677790 [Suillus tomentosus]|nr:hypothetical protein C8R48DRAFT_677790 [Suillus tomentosus]